jgi:hypothetical protein
MKAQLTCLEIKFLALLQEYRSLCIKLIFTCENY